MRTKHLQVALYLNNLNATIKNSKLNYYRINNGISMTMDIEHWSGFTDVELNSLKQRGRGKRSARRSRGQPLNQGTRKTIYPIGRAGNDGAKTNHENLPSGAFFSHEVHSLSATVDNKKTNTDDHGDNSAAEKLGRSDVEKDSVSTESSGVVLTERSVICRYLYNTHYLLPFYINRLRYRCTHTQYR